MTQTTPADPRRQTDPALLAPPSQPNATPANPYAAGYGQTPQWGAPQQPPQQAGMPAPYPPMYRPIRQAAPKKSALPMVAGVLVAVALLLIGALLIGAGLGLISGDALAQLPIPTSQGWPQQNQPSQPSQQNQSSQQSQPGQQSFAGTWVGTIQEGDPAHGGDTVGLVLNLQQDGGQLAGPAGACMGASSEKQFQATGSANGSTMQIQLTSPSTSGGTVTLKLSGQLSNGTIAITAPQDAVSQGQLHSGSQSDFLSICNNLGS